MALKQLFMLPGMHKIITSFAHSFGPWFTVLYEVLIIRSTLIMPVSNVRLYVRPQKVPLISMKFGM